MPTNFEERKTQAQKMIECPELPAVIFSGLHRPAVTQPEIGVSISIFVDFSQQITGKAIYFAAISETHEIIC